MLAATGVHKNFMKNHLIFIGLILLAGSFFFYFLVRVILNYPVLNGVYATNSKLTNIEWIPLGTYIGPEDVAIDAQGLIYCGTKDGNILRFQEDKSLPEVYANTGGRPQGLHFDINNNLIVADTHKGLLSISPDGTITILSTEQAEIPFGFTNDLDIAADSTIYFSDSSYQSSPSKFIEHHPHGRLLSYNPFSKNTRLLLDNLNFANGVAVSPDQSFVLVAETQAYRVTRYWLTGDRKGESDIFIDNLPGLPDGISSNGKDTFWLSLYELRNPFLNAIFPFPLIKKIIMRLPIHSVFVKKRYGFILGLDIYGHIVYNLQDPSKSSYSPITSVEEHGRFLYLGSNVQNAVGRIQVH